MHIHSASSAPVLGVVFLIWLFYTLIPTVLLSFLQWYLCGKNLRWGRVLPIISAVVSVLAFLFFLLFTLNMIGGGWLMAILLPILALVMFNIPTLVFLLVRRARKRRNEQNDLNRMKIEDLE